MLHSSLARKCKNENVKLYSRYRLTHRKNPIDFTSASSSKKGPLRSWFLVNFPNIFQNSFFYKSLLISCFCIFLYYLVFQEITSVTSVGVNVLYKIFHNMEKYFTIIISLWEVMLYRGIFISFTMLQRVTLQNEFYNILAYDAVKVTRGVLCVV